MTVEAEARESILAMAEDAKPYWAVKVVPFEGHWDFMASGDLASLSTEDGTVVSYVPRAHAYPLAVQMGQPSLRRVRYPHAQTPDSHLARSWGHQGGLVFWTDTSLPSAPSDVESHRHREAAAVMDRFARGLLWKISDCTFIPGAEALDLIDEYDDLRAVVRVVVAGWASAAPDGLLVTDRGRDVASQLFVDR